MKYDEIWWKNEIWSNMIKYDQIWSNMIKYDQIWSNAKTIEKWWRMPQCYTKAAAKGAGSVEFHHAKALVLVAVVLRLRVNTFEQRQCVSWGDCKANRYEAHSKTCYLDLFRTISDYLINYVRNCKDIWGDFITLGIMRRKTPGVPRPGLHRSLQSINSGLPETGPEPGKPKTHGPRPQSNASIFIKSIIKIIKCIPKIVQKYPTMFSMPVLSVMFYLGTIASCPI